MQGVLVGAVSIMADESASTNRRRAGSLGVGTRVLILSHRNLLRTSRSLCDPAQAL